MVAGSHSQVSVAPVAPARLWKASVDTRNLIPKLIPDQVESIVLPEGDGGVGSVTQLNFGPALKDIKYVKHKGEQGRDIGTKLKSCNFEVKMEATSERGTKTTVKIDYDTLGDSPLSQEDADNIVGGVLGQTKAIEGHLQANPDAYA
ncbi:major strawberry allergen Fra a 1.07-like [Aristolochia californica]|uniref:major strawberry allergen Fra a 1.07-like n=1 Tax=Aristolochia californica TaxID=171875 RepID=UPI0035DD31ED